VTCVLTVRDDELNIGRQRQCVVGGCWRGGKPWGSHTDGPYERKSTGWFRKPGDQWILLGIGILRNLPVVASGSWWDPLATLQGLVWHLGAMRSTGNLFVFYFSFLSLHQHRSSSSCGAIIYTHTLSLSLPFSPSPLLFPFRSEEQNLKLTCRPSAYIILLCYTATVSVWCTWDPSPHAQATKTCAVLHCIVLAVVVCTTQLKAQKPGSRGSWK